MVTSDLAAAFRVSDKGRPRSRPVFGVTMHTSGIGVVNRAAKEIGVAISAYDAADLVLEFVAAHYANGDEYGAHYCIGWEGQIISLADEDEVIYHTGFSRKRNELARLSSINWRKECSAQYLRNWDKRWPGAKNPIDIFPGTSVNSKYIGIELVPVHKNSPWFVGRWPQESGFFTRQQHASARALCMEIGRRRNFPLHWRLSNRLISHEDVNPISRANRSGGWDIGVCRDEPRFDWSWLTRHQKKTPRELLQTRGRLQRKESGSS